MSVNEAGNDLSDQPVYETATVTVAEPVPNRVPRKRRPKATSQARPVQQITVHPGVLAAAKALVRPGITRLEIVSSECVMVVNVCPATRRPAHKMT